MKRLRLDERIEFALNSKVSVRVYADSRPHVLQTAKLQKGAILVRDGKELVEEGLGIGVPVCRYKDGTHFSLTAETFFNDSESGPSIVKIYDMDGVASKRFRGIPIRRGRYLAGILKVLEKGYRGFRRFGITSTPMLDLLSLLGMTNEYRETLSKGRIEVAYRLIGRDLQIKTNLSGLTREGLQRIVFANESSGRLFGKYTDSTGTKLQDRQIEPWRKTRAEWASLYSRKLGVGFSLRRPSGWLIVRGREVVRERISWSGLDLLSNGIPEASEYSVQIFGEALID